MSKSIRRKCAICWKLYKRRSLFSCIANGQVAEVCINCKNRILRNFEKNNFVTCSPVFIHEIIFSIDKVAFGIGLERIKAVNLVLDNLNELNRIEEIATDVVKTLKSDKPRVIRLNGKVFEIRQQRNDIFDRAIRISGSFYSKK